MLGAKGDAGWVSDGGLDGAALAGFDYAFSGHYHLPQTHPWGMYLGSPLHLKFSEGDVTDRGFWDVDLGAEKLAPKLVIPKFPHFGTVEVELDAGEHLDDYVDSLEEVAEGLTYLRVILKGDVRAIEQSRKLVGDWRLGKDKVGLRHIKLDERPSRATRARLKLTKKTFDLDEALGAYAREFAPDGLDPHELTEIGKRLLGEAGRKPR
jgi:DNA repair exonuclease SbcCD nuclease subunit